MSVGLADLHIDPVGGRAIETAIEVGLFSRLKDQAWPLEDLATVLEVSPRGLRPLLHLLTSLGLVLEDGGEYSAPGELVSFLEQVWPEKKKALVTPPDWKELTKAVRTGRCIRRPIEGEADAGNFFSGIVETLFRLHSGLAKHVGSTLPSSIEQILDLGAGSAVWSLGVLTHNPKAHVVAVDMDKVLREVTSKFVEETGFSEHFELRPGSYHEVELEPQHYDLVYLGHVIHSEGWEATRSLLKRCFYTLKPGCLLAVAEWVGSTPRGKDYHANLFDLNMLMFTEWGLVFDTQEMEALVSEAGFVEAYWEKGPGQYPVLIAKKPLS